MTQLTKLPTNNWKKIIGRPFSPDAFDQYCHTLRWTAWRPSSLVVHNTGSPTLVQRPDGLTVHHIKNLETYYRDTQKWKAGPHLFIDDRQIWVFTPLTVSGVHSPSWNKTSIGIELLGNYETESFSKGRGGQVRQQAVATIATLSAVLGMDPATAIKLHREDPLTTHACPGKNISKQELIKDVQHLLVARHAGEHAMKTFV
jgi:hypothetical protein